MTSLTYGELELIYLHFPMAETGINKEGVSCTLERQCGIVSSCIQSKDHHVLWLLGETRGCARYCTGERMWSRAVLLCWNAIRKPHAPLQQRAPLEQTKPMVYCGSLGNW